MKELKPGIYADVPFEEYLNLPYFSKSFVSHILKSPLHLRHYLDHPEDYENSKMNFGTLVDTLLLEPDKFNGRFYQTPSHYVNAKGEEKPWTMQSNTCKETVEIARKAGLILVSADDKKKGELMVERIKAHRIASQWIQEEKQVTIIWDDPITGIRCKGRMDIYQKGKRVIDLKTSPEARPAAFQNISNKMKYHVQAAMYLMGIHMIETGKYPEDWTLPFSLIVAETEPPHDVVCYDFDLDSLDAGKFTFKHAVEIYAECVKQNKWPGYSEYASEQISLPPWALNKINNEGVFE